VQCCIAALHTVSFVHGCFVGKCILTDSTEQRYFNVDGSMEKKWDTVIPAELKRLFVSGTYKCPTGHERVKQPLHVAKFIHHIRIYLLFIWCCDLYNWVYVTNCSLPKPQALDSNCSLLKPQALDSNYMAVWLKHLRSTP